MQLSPRCSSDGHSKSDTRDEAGTAQGGTNEVWRGQGLFTSVLSMTRGCWTSANQLAKLNVNNLVDICVLRCRIILIPLSNRLETSAPQTLSMAASRHTALYCHQILKVGHVLEIPDSETS